MNLAALGSRLRYSGLMPRALAAWAGTDRLSALPLLLERAPREATRATTLLALFVGGDAVAIDRVPELDALHRAELVDVRDGHVQARVSILPAAAALIVCDRLDTSDSLDIVCWPDDSSYHLALALPPGRKQRWLDLGSGSAFAPLMRPELASTIVAADINPRAVRYAKRGVELSGIGHIKTTVADLGEGIAPELRGACELVSCNAPIPEPNSDAPYRARWRMTDASFVERMFAHARSFVAPEGMVVVHAAEGALEPVLAELPGHRVVVTYTPEGMRGFAIAWWQPDGEDRIVRARRLLTDWRPHLTYEDRLAALTGST